MGKRWRWLGFGVVALLLLFLGWGFRSKVWSGAERVAVTIATPSLVTMVYDPATHRAVVWQLPDTLQLEVVGGYGTYAARSVAGLDRQEKQQGKLVRQSVGNFLGVAMDGDVVSTRVVMVPDRMSKAWIEGRLREGVWARMLGRGESNLSLGDTFRLWKAVAAMRPDEMEIIDLGKTNTLQLVPLPDGAVVYVADLQRVSALTQRYMIDEELVREEVHVLVRNATGNTGLGGLFGRILTTVGIQVVGVEDDDERLDKTMVVVTPQVQKLLTAAYIEKLLGVKSRAFAEVSPRAEIVVRLGKDYKEVIKGK